MIGNQSDRNIIDCVCLIGFARHLTDLIADCFHGINIKYRIHILHDYCKTLKSHTCIDVLLCKLFITALAISFKLCKYIVPNFHKTVTFTTNLTVRISTAVFLSTIIINLRTWSARSCSMLPEVVTCSCLRITVKTCNTLWCNANFLVPDFKGFFVLSINRWIQAVSLKSKHFCQKFPGPCNCFVLKVITKREITKHLKKCKVTCGLTYILNITGTYTLLTGCHSLTRRNLLTGKIRFQWRHSRIDQK